MMSTYTVEEWDKIIQDAKQQVEHADVRATQAERNFEAHMTPHYNMVQCPKCGGSGIAGLIVKGICPRCEGSGRVQSGAPYFNSPGDPYGWRNWEERENPKLARHNLRQTMIKRFVDLNPDHPMSVAIKSGLVQNGDTLLPVTINYHDMSTTMSLVSTDTPVRLLNGQEYPFSVWGVP